MCIMDGGLSPRGSLPYESCDSINFTSNNASTSDNRWKSSTQEAIELVENRLDNQHHYFNFCPTNESQVFSLTGETIAKSNDSVNNKEEFSTPLKIISNIPNGHKRFRSTVCGKPSSILKVPSKHKRCSSLGQNIRYIDESCLSPFVPLTCPSTPSTLKMASPVSYNIECRCQRSVPVLTPSENEAQSWLPKCVVRRASYCNCCGSGYQDLSVLCNDLSLVPPLASAEQLSVLESYGHLDLPRHRSNNESVDRQSLYSINMEKDFRYYFQHPYTRLFIAYFVTFCNFLIFAEDPISHSPTECEIPVVGNVISFLCTKYPPEWPWMSVKVSLWIAAIFVGLVVGKYFMHHTLLRRILRLKMFRDEEGTWMIMILSVFMSCYIFSVIYNFLLLSAHPSAHLYIITTRMGVTNANFMKAAACGTWLGDFFTAWMVTDMMLQDNLYPGWAKGIRAFWREHGYVRIVIFWSGSVGMTTLVVYLIISDDISWDNLNQDFIITTELSRAFLASSILVMDLLIVMQDWDFPHFVCDLDIKLPGLKKASYTLELFQKSVNTPEIFFHITGKWFNYGLIVVVMLLDLNMWKNQIIYFPPIYGQYTGPDHKIFTVSDKNLLATGNFSLWTYAIRASTLDPITNKTYMEGDHHMNSRYLGYPAYVKSLAFLPCAAGFILFFTLISQYGRFPPKTDVSAGGRLRKRNARGSSWRRERRDSRLGGYISWRGITEYRRDFRDFARRLPQSASFHRDGNI